MKRTRDIFIGILIGCILMATPVLADSVLTKIDVVLNGVNVQLEGQGVQVDSILYNGTTYLPMRKVAELVGKNIDWNNDTKTANIVEKFKTEEDERGDDLKENSNEFKLYNDDDLYYYAEKNGEKYISLQTLGDEIEKNQSCFLAYDGDTKSLTIYTDGSMQEVVLNVNYDVYRNRILISESYFNNTILPLIKK
mgnify:CR=1 FL=1